MCPDSRHGTSWNTEPRARLTHLLFDVRCLDDWRPAGNFAPHQSNERLLTSFCLVRNVAADVEQALTHLVVVQCLIERIAEPIENRSRHVLRREQGKPSQSLEFRQPSLLCSRDIRQG